MIGDSSRAEQAESSRRVWLRRSAALAGGAVFSMSIHAQEPPAKNDTAKGAAFTAQAKRAVSAGLGYLASRQSDNGSFGTGAYRNNLAVCGLTGMAFLSSGYLPGRGKHGEHLDRCINYVLANCHDSGYINADQSNTRGPMYEHGFATLFLAEVYGNAQASELRPKLVKAVQLIVKTQNDGGGWRYKPERGEDDVSVTVCQVMALRAAHNAGIFLPPDTIERAIGYIQRCQNDDGGFRYVDTTPGESAFPRSAAAVVAFNCAGIYESEDLTRGLDYLMQFPPRANDRGERSYYFYGHYYAVQAMWHARGRYWQTWYPTIRDVLIKSQRRKDGAWVDAISPEYGTAMACLILRMPESFLPIFER